MAVRFRRGWICVQTSSHSAHQTSVVNPSSAAQLTAEARGIVLMGRSLISRRIVTIAARVDRSSLRRKQLTEAQQPRMRPVLADHGRQADAGDRPQKQRRELWGFDWQVSRIMASLFP
jgi:hypothetical protein